MRAKNKYGNIRTEYNGAKYDSIKEANYAKQLDVLRNSLKFGERVKGWERQVRYDIFVNGEKVCAYVLDFKVEYCDGRVEYVDVKGYKKGAAYSVFTFKKKLMKAVHNITITEK